MIIAVILAVAALILAGVDLTLRQVRPERYVSQESGERALVSYLMMRRIVGGLGMALPFVVANWGFYYLGFFEFEKSISDYYSIQPRDAFVGILFVVAFFLIAYRGYNSTDNRAGYWAGLFALCVAIFPATVGGWVTAIHFIAAVGLFLVLAYFSYFQFTKSDQSPENRGTAKKIRNLIYRICGIVIVAALVAVGICILVMSKEAIESTAIVFWLELIVLEAFGISWMIKGETIFTDSQI